MEKTKQLTDYMYIYAHADMWVTRYHGRKFKSMEMFEEIEEQIREFDGKHLDKYKLILRPIADITQDEISEILKLCTVSIYGDNCEFEISNFLKDTNEVGLICETKEIGSRLGLTIRCDGCIQAIDYSDDECPQHIPIFEITALLLNKGFDLFGLLDTELAIEVSEIENKNQYEKH